MVKRKDGQINIANEPEKSRLYARQNGYCFWCGIEMAFFRIHREGQPIPFNAATIDHVFSRLDPRRYLPGGNLRKVLACNACNGLRNQLEHKALRKTGAVKNKTPRKIYSGQVDYTPVLRGTYGPKAEPADQWLVINSER